MMVEPIFRELWLASCGTMTSAPNSERKPRVVYINAPTRIGAASNTGQRKRSTSRACRYKSRAMTT